ncbi:transcriptional regulator [Arundinibacter roseus]|uniref:Transcriptional regulator n=1 Tax=Arundinibacter roseus TaxID=2070510 RepID=A0A4V2XAF8_9BACT|nr:transcriptional regulator [Arundinibacter roseus]TDB67515.1 transcriptional regulator [Arundinibacter roseus]
MEQINLPADILVYCVYAESFPEDVQKCHETLHSLVPFSPERHYFGISVLENSEMIYKAAANALPEEDLTPLNLEEFTVPKGDYTCILIHDFMNNVPAFKEAFDRLFALPQIDPESYAYEWYISDHVARCMVKNKV